MKSLASVGKSAIQLLKERKVFFKDRRKVKLTNGSMEKETRPNTTQSHSPWTVNKKTEKHLTRLEENYMKFMMCKIIHKHT